MHKDIEAIFLDVGNTLRIVIEDKEFQTLARQQLVELTGAQETPDVFHFKLEERYKGLRKQAKEKLIEASEKEMWTRWMLPDFPAEKIAPLSGKLTRLWRDCDGRRVPREDVSQVVIELSKRGYLLGIIANTITETEIPDYLQTEGLTGYFKTVVLSSKVGIRKPNPEIYWEAARRIGVEPAKCVYVGDNPVRDVEGTRAAGYGLFILFFEPATMAKEPPNGEVKPDYTIHEMTDLLDIFPPRQLGGGGLKG
jgi:putative hydrolase of the HAD superfamily